MSCLFNKTSVISVRKGPFTHGQWRTNPISYRDYLVFSRSSRFIIVFFNKVNIQLGYNNHFVADEMSFPGLKWPVSVAPRWDADAVGSGLILAVRVTPFHRCDVVWERVFSTLLSGCSRQLSPISPAPSCAGRRVTLALIRREVESSACVCYVFFINKLPNGWYVRNVGLYKSSIKLNRGSIVTLRNHYLCCFIWSCAN